jgi:hypothetical protein
MLDGKAPTAVWHEDFVNDALAAFLANPLRGSQVQLNIQRLTTLPGLREAPPGPEVRRPPGF